MFNFLSQHIVFQEVPGEISLLFSITGCDVGCSGCHSLELWDSKLGSPLTAAVFVDYLEQYQDFVSCVVFFGGEWQPNHLVELLKLAKSRGLLTCLYSGQQQIDINIRTHLNFLKLGDYRRERGGLDNPNTNQKFIDLAAGQIINSKFIHTKGI